MMWNWIATHLMYCNAVWYLALTVAFGFAKNWGMLLYFTGATVLTIGVIVLNGEQ